jgi:hypothetical protein
VGSREADESQRGASPLYRRWAAPSREERPRPADHGTVVPWLSTDIMRTVLKTVDRTIDELDRGHADPI